MVVIVMACHSAETLLGRVSASVGIAFGMMVVLAAVLPSFGLGTAGSGSPRSVTKVPSDLVPPRTRGAWPAFSGGGTIAAGRLTVPAFGPRPSVTTGADLGDGGGRTPTGGALLINGVIVLAFALGGASCEDAVED